jgi:hypothetical protein
MYWKSIIEPPVVGDKRKGKRRGNHEERKQTES